MFTKYQARKLVRKINSLVQLELAFAKEAENGQPDPIMYKLLEAGQLDLAEYIDKLQNQTELPKR